jgi:hypothetical protein
MTSPGTEYPSDARERQPCDFDELLRPTVASAVRRSFRPDDKSTDAKGSVGVHTGEHGSAAQICARASLPGRDRVKISTILSGRASGLIGSPSSDGHHRPRGACGEILSSAAVYGRRIRLPERSRRVYLFDFIWSYHVAMIRSREHPWLDTLYTTTPRKISRELEKLFRDRSFGSRRGTTNMLTSLKSPIVGVIHMHGQCVPFDKS